MRIGTPACVSYRACCVLNPVHSPFAELYFLIAKFLASGPCQEAARVSKEIEARPMRGFTVRQHKPRRFILGAETRIGDC